MLSLYSDYWNESSKLWTGKIMYPVQISAPSEAPEDIQKLFQEAVFTKKVSPSLCVVGIRRCLEAVCQDKGATKKTLAGEIAELAEKGVFPEVLVDMMRSSKTLGNLGAHATSASITEEDAQISIDFCLAILEYTYVAPSRIAVIKKRLEKLEGVWHS